MVTKELQKKIDRAIKLLQSVGNGYDGVIEVAYSGGKDSDVILQLAKESGIRYKAIYKNTTIDPPGTIAHAKAMGAEVLQPKKAFFELVGEAGFPNRFTRFCCKFLKEYKVLDKVIMGVRKAESRKRNERYNEPTECRWYGSKKDPANHAEAIYPILNWTDDDIADFINDRKIPCHPLYYDMGGVFHPERRLGCMGCPLKSKKKRIAEFKERPRLVRAYLRAGKKYLDTHSDTVIAQRNDDVYSYFFRDVFCSTSEEFHRVNDGFFGKPDYKAFLEQQFGIDLTL